MSAIRSIIAAAVISAAFAAPAFAREVYTIKLSAPVAEQTRIIALHCSESSDFRAQPPVNFQP